MSHQQHTAREDAEPVPGCDLFEQTLALMDGLLEGDAHAEAQRHAAACGLCGPLVADWAPVSDALLRAFEDAAEAAKPDLAQMPDRVLAAVRPAPAEEVQPGFFGRLLSAARGAQPWVLLAATAGALALVVPALLEAPDTTTVAVKGSEPETVLEEEAPPVVVVRDLDFGDAEGMVYRTPRGGMTIVWVTENEDA